MNVRTSIATETTTGVEGGLDVNVTVEINGLDCDGEVTLVQDSVNGGWCAYGPAPEYWVSGALLSWLQGLDEGYELTEILSKIERAAERSCEQYEIDAENDEDAEINKESLRENGF
jgi:hypothetical protein